MIVMDVTCKTFLIAINYSTYLLNRRLGNKSLF